MLIGITVVAATTAKVQAEQAIAPSQTATATTGAGAPVLLSAADREPEAPASWSNLAEPVQSVLTPGAGTAPGFAPAAVAAPDPSPATLLVGGALVGGWALRRLAAPSGNAGTRSRRPR